MERDIRDEKQKFTRQNLNSIIPNVCYSCSYSDQAQTQITCGYCLILTIKMIKVHVNYVPFNKLLKCSYNSQNNPSVICSSCSTNFKLINDSLKCVSPLANCLDYRFNKYSSNKADCKIGTNPIVTCQPNPTCLLGFYLNGQSCLPCKQDAGNITGSETCCGLGLIFTAGTPNSCVTQTGATGKQQILASNGNGETSKFCEACISNCDNCTDATTCKTCSLDYALLKTKSGVECVLIKCLVVDSTKGCTSCQYGFYLSTINGIGYCLQCLSPLTNVISTIYFLLFQAYSNQAPNVTVSPAAPFLCSNPVDNLFTSATTTQQQ
ncbi:unnamed protein product (macronuclear) [Paramecium tetraurelia]|uniref:Uncharacterized protein n=1 Tax=Paramecium tetraurelia TaxID=5888 RepID=A0BMC9_PARTE|nr:uncharacterized protein GSPATT00030332001 [Paramecium tetraurelia]CAK59696.1 unnamed protein product [Paramecium tetraurelia]|eukprot:XP_001427094.1 hypothetical protein (macronuclear) [Paramecium tetraurelia strain d4-2]